MRHFLFKKRTLFTTILLFLSLSICFVQYIRFLSKNPFNFDFIDPKTSADTDGDGFSDDVENSLGTDPYDKWSYPKPDLNVSSWQYSNNVITIEVMNEGICNATGVVLHVQIPSLGLMIYNNSVTPFFLDVDEGMEIQIDLSEYDPYLVKGKAYKIDIYLDPDDLINETNDINNQLNLNDIVYSSNYNSYPELMNLFLIILITVIIGTLVSVGTLYIVKNRKTQKFNNIYEINSISQIQEEQNINDSRYSDNKTENFNEHEIIQPSNISDELKLKKKDNKIKQDKQIIQELSEMEKRVLEKTEKEISITENEFTCIVHRGAIVGTIYICHHCKAIYCQKCAMHLHLKGETCWSCNNEIIIDK